METTEFFKAAEKTLVTTETGVIDLIKCKLSKIDDYFVVPATPATGIIYIINDFISGHLRMRGNKNGSYPYRYLEMIEAVFGKAEHTFEACSGKVKSDNNTTTADISFSENNDITIDCQNLDSIAINSFDRWRCDPPYNKKAAKKMWNTKLPNTMKLLKAGARIVVPGGLFFLLSAQNYQWCPANLKRVGCILITVVPNNEIRALNIYIKLEDSSS